MMKHEFEDRVGVTVSAYEYANIESAYMACDEDKDTFCKRWVKEGSIKNTAQYHGPIKGRGFSFAQSWYSKSVTSSQATHSMFTVKPYKAQFRNIFDAFSLCIARNELFHRILLCGLLLFFIKGAKYHHEEN